ncbi:MAG: hypothetical protein LBR54_02970, partial [Oscillospiraceae bacterium]|nr:hypothetical protein [Oscillospiraceae bacterium]
MLSNVNLADKTYEEILREAMELIPLYTLYTDEWTNFNAADPGVTVLQNLSAFTALQRDCINTVSDEMRLKLLELLGIKRGCYAPASVLLHEKRRRALTLKAGTKLFAGNQCFETRQEIQLQTWGLKAVYTQIDGVYKDITYLVDVNMNEKTSAYVFGEQANAGAAVYCVFDGIQTDAAGDFIMSVRVKDGQFRNPFENLSANLSEDLSKKLAEESQSGNTPGKWQCYTDTGWENLEYTDETRGFLISGTVRFKLPGNIAKCKETPEHGYALRCVLKENTYDIPPRISGIFV